ncbi:MAG: hypothetical protein H5U38_02855 [Calditrichaeota bacterium]|nr:hypothetical protein [Calditrichota bacterium]
MHRSTMMKWPTARRSNNTPTETTGATLGYEAELWPMAHALRGSRAAGECKHVLLGLILLRYIWDAFEGRRAKSEAT